METVCFTCGEPLGGRPRIPELEDGTPCPACRARLLDALPPILPFPSAAEREDADAGVDADADAAPQPILPFGGSLAPDDPRPA